MPSYIKLGGNIRADQPAYLGSAYAPFNPQGAEKNLLLRIAPEQLDDRKSLLGAFDQMRRDIDQTGTAQGMDQFAQQALQFLTHEASKTFDLSFESHRLRDKYGTDRSPYSSARIGECLLLARRLCEAARAS